MTTPTRVRVLINDVWQYATVGENGGGGSLPASWTVDADTGQFILGFTDTGGINVAQQIDYVGDPTDYIPLLWIGGDDASLLTGKRVFQIDSSGDADWYFRDSGVSLIFHRTHDGESKELIKLGDSTFSLNNTAHTTSMILADYDQDFLQVAASTSTLSFFAGAGAAKQTGVAVDAAGIHAALVAYGLIAA